jgi:hypothetical protein
LYTLLSSIPELYNLAANDAIVQLRTAGPSLVVTQLGVGVREGYTRTRIAGCSKARVKIEELSVIRKEGG